MTAVVRFSPILDQFGSLCEVSLVAKGYDVGFYLVLNSIWRSNPFEIFIDLCVGIRIYMATKRNHGSGQLRYVCLLWISLWLIRRIILFLLEENLFDLIYGDWVFLDSIIIKYGNLRMILVYHRFFGMEIYWVWDFFRVVCILRNLTGMTIIFVYLLD